MSKTKLLLDVVDDLRFLADSLLTLCDAAVSGNQPEETAPEEAPAPAPTKPRIEFEQVRAFLADKSQDGYTDQVKELLSRYGAKKLSDISPDDYEGLMAEAEEIGNG